MPTRNIVFIDSRVSNYQSIIDSLDEPAQVFILDSGSDGLGQMAAYLQGQTGIDAIHVISHGSQGNLYLGNAVLNSGNAAAYGSQLSEIGRSLTLSGDILLYGCNVAQGDVGLQFISSLAQYTGADVAASSNATGSAALGGDWVLEQQVGRVAATGLLSNEMLVLLTANNSPSFTQGSGKVFTDLGSSFDTGSSIAIQSDGKIIVAGWRVQTFSVYTGTSNDFALARYNINGSLDTSFGNNGKVVTDFVASDDFAYDVKLQTDGKILVTGTSGSGSAVARYNTDGDFDTSFSTDGKLTSSNELNTFCAIQPEGKILTAGMGIDGTTFVVTRYQIDGVLDPSFGTAGTAITDFVSRASGVSRILQRVQGIIVQPDGEILVGSYSCSSRDASNTAFNLVRYNSDGTLDSTFGIDGRVSTAIMFYVGEITDGSFALQTDGKILFAGSITDTATSNTDFLLLRYNSNGSLDNSFGTGGKIAIDFSSSNDRGQSVTIQFDGKILIAGNSGSDFALARLNIDGSLDNSFDTDGKVTTDLGYYDSVARVVVQPDGKILVVGSSRNYSGSYGDIALVRYNNDGSLDKTFSPDRPFSRDVSFTENSVQILMNGDIQISDPELSAANSYDGASLTLQRHGAANAQDVFSAASSTLTVLTSGSYFAVDSITIGRVISNAAGTLTLAFNANATQPLVNKAMQQIAYGNTSDAPPSSVQIDWTFNDGNTGAQGTGGSMSVTGSTTVQITATNDAPVLSQPLVDQFVIAGRTFNYTIPAVAFTDPDIESLTYSVGLTNGTALPPWLAFNSSTRTFSGTPGASDIGALDVQVTAKDSSNSSVFDVVRLTVSSTPVSQAFIGTAANDTFTSGPGNDSIDGSSGIDTALYTGSRSNFSLTKTSNGFTLADNTGALGIDTLQNVERIKFTNGGIALDVSATQAAGQTQLMLGAVLGKTLLEHPNNQPLIGTVIDLFDQGYTLNQLSGALMRLPIWDVFTGQANPTNTAIANYLLTRVNGVAPDATTLANAAAALDAQTDYAHGLGDFLGQLALTPANQTQVGFVGLANTGMAFGW